MMHSRYTDYLKPITAEPDIHDVRKAGLTPQEIGFSLLLCLVFGVVDFALTWLVWAGSLPVFLGVCIHLLATAIALALVNAKRKAGLDSRFSMLLVLLLACTGVFGAVGGLIAIAAHAYHRNLAFTFREWFDFIYPRPRVLLGEATYDNIALGTDEHSKSYDVTPYMDIMRVGSDNQKREAINQIAMHFHPRMAPALQAALADESHVVRTLAAISVVKIQSHFNDLESRLLVALKRNEGRVDYLLAAGQFYDDFAFTDLLDSQRRSDYLNKAYDYYQRYLRRNASDIRVVGWVGRLLVRSGQHERAIDWLKRNVDSGFADATVISWYAEALYQLHHYADVAALMRQHGHKLKGLDSNQGAGLSDVVTLWTRGAVA